MSAAHDPLPDLHPVTPPVWKVWMNSPQAVCDERLSFLLNVDEGRRSEQNLTPPAITFLYIETYLKPFLLEKRNFFNALAVLWEFELIFLSFTERKVSGLISKY